MHVKSAQTLHINMVGYLGPLTIAIAGGRSRRSSGSNARNVLAYAISQGIAHRLERGTGKDADAARIPLARRHPIERNRARVAEAVAAKFFDLP
jgi:hypothetical protein